MKKVFTTGEVAKICKVAPRTVSKWFDSGRLKGFRISGTQDRRIPREYLIKFLKEHGMPLGDLEDYVMVKVLILSGDEGLIEKLKQAMPPEKSFKVEVSSNCIEAGIQCERFHPDAILVDFEIGRISAFQVCNALKENPDFSELIIVALLTDDLPIDISSVVEVFERPFDENLLGERLLTLIGPKKELT